MNRDYLIVNIVVIYIVILLISFIVWAVNHADYVNHNHASAYISDTSVIVDFSGEEKARPVYVNDHGNIVKVWGPSMTEQVEKESIK